MRRLRIQHTTEYSFSSPVTLNQHRLLLRPREGHDVRIESSQLSISPAYHIKWFRDVLDNSMALVDFLAPATRLSIVSNVVIQHYSVVSPNLHEQDYALSYPFSYAEEEGLNLSIFQQPVFVDDQPAIVDWLNKIGLAMAPMNILHLLGKLNTVIHSQFRYQMREAAGVQSPVQTLQQGGGSCRDYATLFIETCRSLGLASRFVSGYLHAPATEAGHASTHAWAEVYLPDIGWKGFDPTIGKVASNQHIAVAVARNSEAIPPVSGSFTAALDIGVPDMAVDVQVNLLD